MLTIQATSLKGWDEILLKSKKNVYFKIFFLLNNGNGSSVYQKYETEFMCEFF